MILCPNCGAKLPDRTWQCQFCQQHIDPASVASTNPQAFGPAPWVVATYYAVSIYFIINGLVNTLVSALPLMHPHKQIDEVLAFIGILFGVLTALFGLGLALRVEFVRGIANFVCGVEIILGLLCAPSTIVLALALGPLGALLLLGRTLNIALAAFMIYLIGETDRLTANI